MIIEQINSIALLFDFYGIMLTNMQQDVIKLYVFNNLSLSEIAEQFGTTRQAVKDLLDRSIEILNNYEHKLEFIKKYKCTQELLINT